MSKRKVYLTKIAYMGVFTALCAILNIFTYKVTESFAISFTATASLLAGAFLGPVPALVCAGLGDIIGCIIHPMGAYLPTITIASALFGFIPGVMFKIFKRYPEVAIILSFVLTYFICTIAINTTTLWYVYSRAKGKTYWAYLIARLPNQSIISIVNLVLSFLLYYPLKRMIFDKTILNYSNDNTQSKEK